ncbi:MULTISPECIES: DUF6575 domain-containing protein [unclassified Amycolatopsis]|uniref:DUF6575 domain-containing protein n=1 Tax=unclassified Amycolatopsis TaxID=2618356 RepID=UPI002877201C|nr:MULTISPECIES: DUF6575 domain-containing protein [unclassified Amycolatopsis]MDS0135764.1 ImmA/IrrE family metallo-endopeptidase [Amycolatopsis sp. 505]MDS0145635.1 ImmA/IrrE family metallo-endopeptidase [Amycolatopsis sp. CM201R]
MSDVPPVGTELGTLSIDDIFVDYDGPKLFTCADEAGHVYLAVFVDEDEDVELYLYCAISRQSVELLRHGDVSIREMIEHPLGGNVWLVERSLTTPKGAIRRLRPDEIPLDWYPDEGARLSSPRAAVVEDTSDIGTLWTFGGDNSGVTIALQSGVRGHDSDAVTVNLSVGEDLVVDSMANDRVNSGTSTDAQEVLRRLVETWPFLEWEESTPWGSLADDLDDIFARADAEEKYNKNRNGDGSVRESRDFLDRHNLSRIFASEATRTLAVRRGSYFAIRNAVGMWEVPAGDLLGVLEQLGNTLLRIAEKNSSNPTLRAAWQQKRSLSTSRMAEISTGIDWSDLNEIQQRLDDPDLWVSQDDPSKNELFAAARMSSALDSEEIADIVRAVMSSNRGSRDALDSASDNMLSSLNLGAVHYEVGYELADRFRRYLDLDPSEPINPEEWLLSLGVEIRSFSLASVIDAVAVWGPLHGPCIVVNDEGLHSQSLAGRRITLAHELCHLLIDRRGSLPLVEVLGGRVLESAEARARAFAAELLLPREVAGAAFANSSEPLRKFVDAISKEYVVSREVVAWQIRNSSVVIPVADRSKLRSYVTRPDSY